MAEFSEVMRQFDRMCKANAGCFNCPLHEPDGVSDRCSIGAFINDSERIEREIMCWAAENPEPGYPTWGEWFLRTCQVPVTKEGENDFWRTLNSRIPADIAQKLGIEPKEG